MIVAPYLRWQRISTSSASLWYFSAGGRRNKVYKLMGVENEASDVIPNSAAAREAEQKVPKYQVHRPPPQSTSLPLHIDI